MHGFIGGEALAGLREDIPHEASGHWVRPFHEGICGLSLQWFELR